MQTPPSPTFIRILSVFLVTLTEFFNPTYKNILPLFFLNALLILHV